jgi:hypothetical protein
VLRTQTGAGGSNDDLCTTCEDCSQEEDVPRVRTPRWSVRKSRLSARDLQLGMANKRLKVALKRVQMQEAAMDKVTEMSVAAKSDMMTKQVAAQKTMMDERLTTHNQNASGMQRRARHDNGSRATRISK